MGQTPRVADAAGGTAEAGWRAGLSLLQDRDFRRLFIARLISAFGSAMVFVALPFAVIEVVGSDEPEAIGYVVACASGTLILFQLFAGAWADRGSRQRLMVRADVLAFAAQAAMAFVLLAGVATIPIMMAISAVIGLAMALHWPASVGLIPLVVEKSRLQQANSLLALANNFSMGLGAAAGGMIAALWSAGWAIAADAITFGVSGLLVWTLHPRPQPPANEGSLLRSIREGWSEFTAHRWLWTIVAQFSLVVMGWQAAFAVVGPIVADREMGGVSAWGIVAAGFGIGLVGGALLALNWRPQRPMLVGSLCVFVLALPPLLLVRPVAPAAVALGAFTAGLAIELFSVYWNTALHTHVAPEVLSRVSSYDVVGSMLFAPVGEALAGAAVAAYGTPTTLQVCAALVIVPTILVLFVPEVRSLRSVPPGTVLYATPESAPGR